MLFPISSLCPMKASFTTHRQLCACGMPAMLLTRLSAVVPGAQLMRAQHHTLQMQWDGEVALQAPQGIEPTGPPVCISCLVSPPHAGT